MAKKTHSPGSRVVYACVSTQGQDPALQLDTFKTAGCDKIFTEKASGAQWERP